MQTVLGVDIFYTSLPVTAKFGFNNLFILQILMWHIDCLMVGASNDIKSNPRNLLTMHTLKKIALGVAVAASFCASSFASVVQSTAPVNYTSTSGWHDDLLSLVVFANGTNQITALTGSATIKDQGWGGEWEAGNQIYLSLVQNGTSLWTDHFAGGTHSWRTVNFDIANDPLRFSALNAAIHSIDWAINPNVSLQLRSSTIGYPGWQLYVQNAQFSVTSGQVPEPASLMLLGLGLAGLAASRRKTATK